MPVYLVLIGLPGAGKGTQAALLSKQHGLAHVSSGDLFRDNIKRQTPLGQQVEAILKRGDLVPDDVTIAMVRDRLKNPECAKGAVLDGFPRTRPQAEALDELLKKYTSAVYRVLYFDLGKESAIKRITDRVACSKDDKHNDGYNLTSKPPKVPGICDVCGAPLTQRKDDTREAAEKRISLYFEQTSPLLDYYRGRGLLREVKADQPIEKVTADSFAALT